MTKKRQPTAKAIKGAEIALEVFKDLDAALNVSLLRRCDGMAESDLDKIVSNAVTMLGHWCFDDVEDLVDLLRSLDDFRDAMRASQ